MKVLFISHENELNGSGRSMLSLMDRLRDRVIFYLLTTKTDGLLVEEAKKTGATVLQKHYFRWIYEKGSDENWEHWKNRWKCYHNEKNEQVARELAEFVINERIDIVHTNVGVIDIGARIKKLCNVKHIWHFREFADLDFNMYPLVTRETYINTINDYSDKCVFVSNAVFNHYDFVKSGKKLLIYNGIEDEGIAEHGDGNCISILMSGMVCEAKGQMIAAKACGELISEGYDITLYIAGICDKQSEKDLYKVCSSGLVLCGYVKNMKELRRKIDIQLVCSKNEGFGRPTVEAMLAEIPVIGSHSGGTPELIPDENAGGLLFIPGDYLDLKEKIKYLYLSSERRISIGKNGRKRALKMFSIDRYVNRVYETYKEVVNS